MKNVQAGKKVVVRRFYLRYEDLQYQEEFLGENNSFGLRRFGEKQEDFVVPTLLQCFERPFLENIAKTRRPRLIQSALRFKRRAWYIRIVLLMLS
jgi:hypothetical protein